MAKHRDPSYQLPMFSPGRVDGYQPPIVADLPMWKDAARVAIDYETKDDDLDKLGPGVNRDGCFVAGWAISIDWGGGLNYEHHYVPVNHFGGGNVENPEHAWEWMRDNAREFRGEVINAWLGYDLRWGAKYGVRFPNASGFEDPLVNSPLINELHDRHGLDFVLKRAGFPGKDLTKLHEAARQYKVKIPDARKMQWKFHAGDVAPYGIGDVADMFPLVDYQHKIIEEQGLTEIWELEKKVLPVAAKMSERGVRIDWDHLERVDRRIGENIAEQLGIIKDHTLVELGADELDKKKALIPVFKEAGIELPLTEKSGEICTKKEVLEAIEHPVVEALLSARNSNFMRKMFVNQVRKMAVGDRIHCTFNQIKRDSESGRSRKMGTIARFSATNPSLQNQPQRTEEGKFFRQSYIPEEGKRWVKIDYSGQEVRLMMHYAALSSCTGDTDRVPPGTILPALEMIHENPRWKLHEHAAEVAGCSYFEGKESVFQFAYGSGWGKICKHLGYPTEVGETRDGRPCLLPGEEGRRVLQRIFAAAPFIKPLRNHVQIVADGRGYIITILGRRQRFKKETHPKPGGDLHEDVYKALSRLIQGSAADQTKAAMVALDAEGVPLQLQVHDEIDFSSDDPEEAAWAAEIMQNIVPLKVKVLADVETGSSWGAVEKGWAPSV